MTQRILIVEDDPITARYLELGLKRMGYASPRIAATSEATLETAAADCPDLVLMDIQIEGARDGIDTARILRERHDVPVIFLTGLADEATMERAKSVGPHGYLVKPVKAEDLRTALVAAFQKEQLARTMRETETWFAATRELIDEAMLGYDALGQLTFVNSAARQLLGRDDGVLTLCATTGAPVSDVRTLPEIPGTFFLERASGRLEVSVSARRVLDERSRRLGTVLLIRSAQNDTGLEAEVRRLRAENAAHSLTDDLTGLHNRRGFNVLGDQQLKLLRRGRNHVSVLLIALAHLKEINQEFGHDAGDQAMRDLAKVLRETFRESDVLARLGGGEFAVLASTNDTPEMVGRLRANIAAHNSAAGRPWQLEVQVGVTMHQPKDAARIPELLEAAAGQLSREFAS